MVAKGEVDRAITDFDKAIQLKSDYADAYYNRSIAYDVKGEVDRAAEDYNKAIQLNPNYADRDEVSLHIGTHKKNHIRPYGCQRNGNKFECIVA